ncbi:MAG: hypothetical protein JNK15_03770 [Planctomycetes bacterium]|nr:hypothetical protein [Planctomycetota bacterium]
MSSGPLPGTPAPAEERRDHRDGAFVADLLTTPTAEPLVADDADRRGVVVRGRLTVRQQPWVHPANLEVRVTRSWLDSVLPTATEPSQRAPLRDEPRTRTDEQGRFAFRLLPAEDEMFFLIGLGTEWQDFQKISQLPRSGGELDLGDVWLDQRGSIVGRLEGGGDGATVRVVDDPLLDGAAGFEDLHAARLAGIESFHVPGTMRAGPLPEWVVHRDQFLPFPRAIVARDGTFRVDGVRPGNHDVLATGTFGQAKCAGVLVAPGRTTDVGVVRWRQASPLSMRVVDETSKPWVGAEVAIVHDELGFGSRPIRTDANGEVDLLVIDPGSGSLVVALPGGAPWQRVPWPQHFHGECVVPRPRDLVVHLTDAAGKAIAGGKVRCFTPVVRFRREDRPLPAGWQPKETTPGVHSGKVVGAVVVVASAPGHAPAIANVNGPTTLTLQLLDAGRMTVRTVDTDGKPVADASVHAHVHANPELRFPGAEWDALGDDRVLLGRTDERGELQVPTWGTFFSFQARHPDFAKSIGPRVLGQPGTVHTIVLRGGGDVVGTLVAEQRPAPRGLRVRARQRPPTGHELEHSGWLDERLAVTGDRGAFAFRGLVAGIWELVPELPPVPGADGATTPRFDTPPRQVLLDVGQELHLQLALDPGGFAPATISGAVTQNGGACAGALVRVREIESNAVQSMNALRTELREQGRPMADLLPYGRLEVNPWLARCTTDTFGDFRFRDLREGAEYELRIDAPCGGRMQFVERRIVRAPSLRQPLRIDVALTTAPLQLTFSTNTRAFGNRMVRLRQALGRDQEGACYELLTDANGNLQIADLPIGHWTVEPMHGGTCKPAEFDLAVGQAPALAIEVAPARFTPPTRNPSPGAKNAKRR